MDTDAGAPAPAAAALFAATRGSGGGDSGGRASALEVAPAAPRARPARAACHAAAAGRCAAAGCRAVSSQGCPALLPSLGAAAGMRHAESAALSRKAAGGRLGNRDS